MSAPTPLRAAHPFGFANPEDYLLFGLLVRHGLCSSKSFPLLAEAQRNEFGGQPLFDILAEVNNLPPKTRASIGELLHILGTPKLREFLPQELPQLRTWVETMEQTRREAESPDTVVNVQDSQSRRLQVSSLPVSEAESPTVTMTSVDVGPIKGLSPEELAILDASRSKSILVGMVLSGIVILDRLGGGGQGEVFLGKQLSLNRLVALKRIEVPEGASAGKFLAAFRREAQVLAQVNHARIVKVFEIFESDGEAFFSMEFLRGKTLKEMVRSLDAPLPLEIVANLACQACSALARTAHEGLIHRDIKPDNIIVDENGDLKIVDFGIAAAGAQLSGDNNRFAGTIMFAAPEQLDGGPLSAATDQYCLGLTLWFALTGHLPTQQWSLEDVARERRESAQATPSSYNTALPRSVDRVIARMLERDPAKRFPSFDEAFKAWQKIFTSSQSDRVVAPQQLLGDALIALDQEQRRRLWVKAGLFVGLWVFLTAGTILSEWQLRGRAMGEVLELAGTVGSGILLFSLACIAYVASARRGWIPVIGSLRAWLYTHIATAILSVALLMIHSGNFLMGILPGGVPGKPLLGVLMSTALLATAISGSVGLLIFRELRRQVALNQLRLRSGVRNQQAEMLTVLGANLLSGWRLVHYPLAFFFVLLSILHILLQLQFF